MQLPRDGLTVVAIALGLLMSPAARAQDGWLTDSEREFFEGFGVFARLDGVETHREPTPENWPDVADRAPAPLSDRIRTIVRALADAKPSAEESARMNEIMQQGVGQMQGKMLGGMIDAALGRDPGEIAANIGQGMMKEGGVSEAWTLQRQWLERSAAAAATADRTLDEILEDLGSRAGNSRSTSDLPLKVVVEGGKLELVAEAKAAFVQPVLQWKIHRKGTNGSWTTANVISSGILGGLGIGDVGDHAEGGRLAAAQEARMNRPSITTMLLPDLAQGTRLAVPLGRKVESALGIEKIDARVWSGGGWLYFDQIPGLDAAVKLAAAKVRRSTPSRPGLGGARPSFSVPARPGTTRTPAPVRTFGDVVHPPGSPRTFADVVRPGRSTGSTVRKEDPNLTHDERAAALLRKAVLFEKKSILDAEKHYSLLAKEYPRTFEGSSAEEWLERYPSELLQRGRAAALAGKDKDAAAHFDRLDAAYPDDDGAAEARDWLGKHARRLLGIARNRDRAGLKEEARTAYRRLASECPRSEEARIAVEWLSSSTNLGR